MQVSFVSVANPVTTVSNDGVNDVSNLLFFLVNLFFLHAVNTCLESEEITIWEQSINDISDSLYTSALVLLKLIGQIFLVLVNDSFERDGLCVLRVFCFLWLVSLLFFFIFAVVGHTPVVCNALMPGKVREKDDHLWAFEFTVWVRQCEGL